MQKKINKWLLSALRAKAEQIDVLIPESMVYHALCEFIDSCNEGQLGIIKTAQIRWISTLAQNRLKQLEGA